jgi:DHA1 family tetracycline resistance protein-like MFS transporter
MKKSKLTVIFMTIFLDLIGFGLVLPLLPFYAEHFHASATTIGLLTATYSLMQLLFNPIWGRISDRIGRRPIILLSIGGSVISFLFWGLAHNLTMLFIARSLAGIAGGNIAATQAYIADVTTKEDRAKGMGIVGAAFGLGFIFGPFIGGILDRYGYGAPGFFASGLSLINFLLAFFLLPESLDLTKKNNIEKRSFTLSNFFDVVRRPGIDSLLVTFLLITLAFSSMYGTFALLTETQFGYHARENGYLFTFIGIVAVIMQGGLIGRLSKKFGEAKLLTAGNLLMIIGLSLIPYAPNWWVLCLVLAFLGIGNGMNAPSLFSLISQNTPAEEQGGVMGLAQSLGSLGRALGPALGGWIYDTTNHHVPYLLAGLLMVLASLFSINFMKNYSPQTVSGMDGIR